MYPLLYPAYPHLFLVFARLNGLVPAVQILHRASLDKVSDIVGHLIVFDQPLEEISEVLRTHARRICRGHVFLIHTPETEIKDALTRDSAAHILALHIGSMQHQSMSARMCALVEPSREEFALHLHLSAEVRRHLFFVHLHFLIDWKLCKVFVAALAALVHRGHELAQLIDSRL